jgi:creatinine amidohydrolase/Fe(II)-dependent formamide hydrolase-like protein
MDAFRIQSPLYIPFMTFREIRASIDVAAPVVLPVSVMEPVGPLCTVGAASAVCMAVADRLSCGTAAALAPPYLYGCAVPYRSFEGCAGVKRSTLEHAVAGILDSLLLQGFRHAFVVDGTSACDDVLRAAARRTAACRKDRQVHVLSWTADARVRKYIEERCGGPPGPRCELAVMSMAASIDPGLVRTAQSPVRAPRTAGAEKYAEWRKRGSDPERFKKLFPDGVVSDASMPCSPAAFGGELLAFISELFTRDIVCRLTDDRLKTEISPGER